MYSVEMTADGPARLWRLVQRRAAMRVSGGDPGMLPVPDEDYDIEAFFGVMTDRSIRQEIVEASFPDHYRALRWYLMTSPSSPRWLIEAWLMTGRPLDDILPRMGLEDHRLVVDIYRRAFFDIPEEKRESQVWMAEHVWVPAGMHQTALFYYDYILKLAGFTKPDLIDALVNPGHLTNDAVRWVRQTVEDIRDRSVLLTGNILDRAPLEIKAVANENAMRAWREDRANEGLAAQDSAALLELMEVVKSKASILEHDEEQPETQEFSVEKYSDEDVKKPSRA